jgi:hypothetical protein
MEQEQSNIAIKDITFNKDKDYFLAHIFVLETAQGFIRENKIPFRVNFFEVFFITDGEGFISLDYEQIPIKKGMILCLPPSKIREWALKKPLKGYALIFEEEFFSGFFNDVLFIWGDFVSEDEESKIKKHPLTSHIFYWGSSTNFKGFATI